MKNITLLLVFFLYLGMNAQKIEASFVTMNAAGETIDNPKETSTKDKLLVLSLFDLEAIKKYNTFTVVISINGWKVEDYTYDLLLSSDNTAEFYEGADISSKNPGKRYKYLLIANSKSEEDPEGLGQFNISNTSNYSCQKYIYSRTGCDNVKEYTLSCTVYGQNVTYYKEYGTDGILYTRPNYGPRDVISNTCEIKVITDKNIDKCELNITGNKIGDLKNLINSANKQTGN